MRFSIRDLLLVTVIVEILVAWSIDYGRQAEEVHELHDILSSSSIESHIAEGSDPVKYTPMIVALILPPLSALGIIAVQRELRKRAALKQCENEMASYGKNANERNQKHMKISIRDLLLVTVIVAVSVAWATDHRRWAKEIQRLNVERFWSASS